MSPWQTPAAGWVGVCSKRRGLPQQRRGATLVEAAIVLPVFLTIILGLLDLAGAVYRHNLISEVARRGAREAMVLGGGAGPRRMPLGPQTWTGTAASPGDVSEAVRPLLAGIAPADVSLRLEWPDGSNAAPNRVRCTATTQYQGATFVLTGWPITLRASSTLRIAK